MNFVPLTYCPDLDTNWNVNPGALTVCRAAPLINGAYGSVASATYLSGTFTGANHLAAYIFRSTSGSTRFLTFRTGDIDEYDSAGTRTNRATGLTTATEWSAAAWGDQIIAVSKANATQSSTGAGFSALGGSSPKARHIATNSSFVMMADVDDGASNVYKDMVWWCGIQNPASWTPSIATQAGNQRLLDAPGPITCLTSYGDKFVVFKDNAVFVGEYVGPAQFIFNWRMISNRVGCVGPKAVTELDGKLYFMHYSGIYEFDGMTIRNVSTPVFKSYLGLINYVSPTVEGASNVSDIARTFAVADDIDGVVWFSAQTYTDGGGGLKTWYAHSIGYNVRTGKWGSDSHTFDTGGGFTTRGHIYVNAITADLQSFKADSYGRFLIIGNQVTNAALKVMRYPYTMTSDDQMRIQAGILGQNDRATTLSRAYLRHLYGSTTFAPTAATSTVYQNEDLLTTVTTVNLTANTELNSLDGLTNDRYRNLFFLYGSGKQAILAGIAVEAIGNGRR